MYVHVLEKVYEDEDTSFLHVSVRKMFAISTVIELKFNKFLW